MTTSHRIAAAGLSRVLEPGVILPGDLARLQPCELWEALRTGAAGTKKWSGRVAAADPARDLERAAALGIRFVIPGDEEYPDYVSYRLAIAASRITGGDAPWGLWIRGAGRLDQILRQSVTFTGSRASSTYGEKASTDLASDVAQREWTVVTGGGYGCESSATRGALDAGGQCVAVLASGVDVPYPRSNEALLDKIASSGVLVSELPPSSSPTKDRFTARNRLLAVLTKGTVVVEASERSGALHVAGWAHRTGRPLLAVPGQITDRMSDGPNSLLRKGIATVATCADDIVNRLTSLS
jgi:DNA processing protein